MPVEIKELVIRARVTTAADEAPEDSPDTANDQDTLVEACVRQVLEILKREKER